MAGKQNPLSLRQPVNLKWMEAEINNNGYDSFYISIVNASFANAKNNSRIFHEYKAPEFSAKQQTHNMSYFLEQLTEKRQMQENDF